MITATTHLTTYLNKYRCKGHINFGKPHINLSFACMCSALDSPSFLVFEGVGIINSIGPPGAWQQYKRIAYGRMLL